MSSSDLDFLTGPVGQSTRNKYQVHCGRQTSLTRSHSLHFNTQVACAPFALAFRCPRRSEERSGLSLHCARYLYLRQPPPLRSNQRSVKVAKNPTLDNSIPDDTLYIQSSFLTRSSCLASPNDAQTTISPCLARTSTILTLINLRCVFSIVVLALCKSR